MAYIFGTQEEFNKNYAGPQTELLEKRAREFQGRQDDFCLVCLRKDVDLFPKCAPHEFHYCPRQFCAQCAYIDSYWRDDSKRRKNKKEDQEVKCCQLCWKRGWDHISPLHGDHSPEWQRKSEDYRNQVQSLRHKNWELSMKSKEGTWRKPFIDNYDHMSLKSDRDLIAVMNVQKKTRYLRVMKFTPLPAHMAEGTASCAKIYEPNVVFERMASWLCDALGPPSLSVALSQMATAPKASTPQTSASVDSTVVGRGRPKRSAALLNFKTGCPRRDAAYSITPFSPQCIPGCSKYNLLTEASSRPGSTAPSIISPAPSSLVQITAAKSLEDLRDGLQRPVDADHNAEIGDGAAGDQEISGERLEGEASLRNEGSPHLSHADIDCSSSADWESLSVITDTYEPQTDKTTASGQPRDDSPLPNWMNQAIHERRGLLEQIQNLKAEKTTIAQELTHLSTDNHGLHAEVTEAKRRVGELTEQMEELGIKNTELERSMEVLQQEMSELRKSLDVAENDQIKANHETDSVKTQNITLNAQLSSLGRRVKASEDEVVQLKQDLGSLDEKELSLQALLDRKEGCLSDMSQKVTTLELANSRIPDLEASFKHMETESDQAKRENIAFRATMTAMESDMKQKKDTIQYQIRRLKQMEEDAMTNHQNLKEKASIEDELQRKLQGERNETKRLRKDRVLLAVEFVVRVGARHITDFSRAAEAALHNRRPLERALIDPGFKEHFEEMVTLRAQQKAQRGDQHHNSRKRPTSTSTADSHQASKRRRGTSSCIEDMDRDDRSETSDMYS